MRTLIVIIALSASAASQSQIQTAAKPPQTARQALLEMFLGKAPDSLAKHLPALAKQAMITKGETPQTSIVQCISLIGRQIAGEGHVETFDDGPTLLVSEQTEGKQKIKYEVLIESDSYTGDEDEIELSLHVYRDGQPQFLYVLPRLTFLMTQEKEVWKLTEISLAARVPLTDPEYLKGVRKKINENNEILVSGRVGAIAFSETTYAKQHPGHGYTCSLSDLFPKGPSDTMAFYGASPFPASNEWAGYNFEVSGCEGNPATKYQITATPLDAEAGMKAFCVDESGTVKFDASGSGSACLSSGQPLNKSEGSPPVFVD